MAVFKAYADPWSASPFEFDSLNLDSGNTFALSALAKYEGTYGYRAEYGGVGVIANGFKDLGVTYNELYYAVALFSPAAYFGLSDGNTVQFEFMQTSGGVLIARLELQYHAGNGQYGMRVAIRHNAGQTYLLNDLAGSYFGKDSWHHFEVRFLAGTGDGGYSFWFDETLMDSNYTLSTTTSRPQRIKVGSTAGSIPTSAHDYWWDNCLITETGPHGWAGESSIRSVKKASGAASRIILARR